MIISTKKLNFDTFKIMTIKKHKFLYYIFLFSVLLLINIKLLGQNISGSEERKIIIGFIGKNQTNPIYAAAYVGARLAAKELSTKKNINIIIDSQTPESENPQDQTETIERLSRLNTDGIIISPANSKILFTAINKAIEQGIPVVCIESDAPSSQRLAYCGSNNIEIGKALVRELRRIMSRGSIFAILAGNKNSLNNQERIQSIMEELKDNNSIKLAVNGIYHHDENPDKAIEILNRTQKSRPEIQGWILLGGWPLFVDNGIKFSDNNIKIVACDAVPKQLEYLKNDQVQVLLAQNCFIWGYKSVEILINKILTDQQPFNTNIIIPFSIITNENADEWSLTWRKWMLKDALQ